MNKTNTPSSPRPGARALLGDCRSVLSTLPAQCADLVLTDPPYLVNYRDRSGRRITGDDNSRWVQPAFTQIYRAMRPNSFCVSFYGWTHAEFFITAWKAAGFRLVGHLVFVKPYSSGGRLVQRRHEQAMLLAKGHPALPSESLPDVLSWGRYTGNRLHPTQKPVDMLQRLVRSFSKPGDLVLDPFCGSGSTLVAAQLEGRRALGIERETEIWKVAQNRLSSS